jgi:hypothetical protein
MRALVDMFASAQRFFRGAECSMFTHHRSGLHADAMTRPDFKHRPCRALTARPSVGRTYYASFNVFSKKFIALHLSGYVSWISLRSIETRTGSGTLWRPSS